MATGFAREVNWEDLLQSSPLCNVRLSTAIERAAAASGAEVEMLMSRLAATGADPDHIAVVKLLYEFRHGLRGAEERLSAAAAWSALRLIVFENSLDALIWLDLEKFSSCIPENSDAANFLKLFTNECPWLPPAGTFADQDALILLSCRAAVVDFDNRADQRKVASALAWMLVTLPIGSVRNLLPAIDLASWPAKIRQQLALRLAKNPRIDAQLMPDIIGQLAKGDRTFSAQAVRHSLKHYVGISSNTTHLAAFRKTFPWLDVVWRHSFTAVQLRAEDAAVSRLITEMKGARPELVGDDRIAWEARALIMAGRPKEALDLLEPNGAPPSSTALAVIWAEAVLEIGDVQRIRSAAKVGMSCGQAWTRMTAISKALDRLGLTEDSPFAPKIIPDDIFNFLLHRAPPPYSPAPLADILVVTAGLGPGGAERQTVATVNALDGHDGRKMVLAVQNLDRVNRRDFFLPDLQRQHREVVRLDHMKKALSLDQFSQDVLTLMPSGLKMFAEGLCHLIDARRPCLIHAWQDTTNIAAATAALLMGCPGVVLSCRSTRPTARKRARSYLKPAYRALFDHPRFKMLNNSKAGAEDYSEWMGVDPSRIGVIENGFDLRALKERAEKIDRANLRREWNIPDGARIMGGVMRLSEEKRPHLFVETAMELCRKDSRFFAVLAGNGPMADELARAIAEAGLHHRIKLLGHVNPIEPTMAAFDLLFLSSCTEGLPNVIIEAQALGVPVAAMDVGGVKEAIAPAPAGILLVEGPAPQVAEVIWSALSDPDWIAQASPKAAQFVVDSFSSEVMAKKTLDVYRSLASL